MHWKIRDFVEEIKRIIQEDIHVNTVDGWFKKLEKDKIHYINRAEGTNEKIYDELDLKIATFIKKKRNEKWSLAAIFNEIKDNFDLRLFPAEDNESTNAPQVVDVNAVKVSLQQEMKSVFEEIAATQLNEIREQLQLLPKPKTLEEEREERIQEIMARRKVENKLRAKALNIWSTKPEEERYRRVGWFRKELNIEGREEFVRRFIDERFESELRKEFGFED